MSYDYQAESDQPVTDLIKAAINASCRPNSNSDHNALRVAVKRYLVNFPNPFKDEDGNFPVRPNHLSRGKLVEAVRLNSSLDQVEYAAEILRLSDAEVYLRCTASPDRVVQLPLDMRLARDLVEVVRHERAVALADIGVKPYDEA